MIDFATMQAAIKSAVNTILGYEGGDAADLSHVKWIDEAQAATFRAHPWIDLSINGLTGVGVDEERQTYVDPLIELALVGNREFTLSIKAEYDTQTPGAGVSREWLENLRLGLRRRSVREGILAPAGLAVVRYEANQVLNFTQDGRRYSAAVFDAILAVRSEDIADPGYDGAWIETADVTGAYS